MALFKVYVTKNVTFIYLFVIIFFFFLQLKTCQFQDKMGLLGAKYTILFLTLSKVRNSQAGLTA